MTGFDEPPVEIEKPTVLNPQQLMEAIRTRRTIRRFKNQPIASEVIAQIIEAGRLTPSGRNAQDVSYIVLKDDKERYEKMAVRLFNKLLSMAKLVSPAARRITIDDHFFFKKAPAVIMVLSKDKINGALAAANMALMAEAHGLGVLYSGFFAKAANHSRALRRALKLTHKNRVVTTLVLGYSNVTYHRTAQKDVAVVRYL
jgi:nitroreductase